MQQATSTTTSTKPRCVFVHGQAWWFAPGAFAVVDNFLDGVAEEQQQDGAARPPDMVVDAALWPRHQPPGLASAARMVFATGAADATTVTLREFCSLARLLDYLGFGKLVPAFASHSAACATATEYVGLANVAAGIHAACVTACRAPAAAASDATTFFARPLSLDDVGNPVVLSLLTALGSCDLHVRLPSTVVPPKYRPLLALSHGGSPVVLAGTVLQCWAREAVAGFRAEAPLLDPVLLLVAAPVTTQLVDAVLAAVAGGGQDAWHPAFLQDGAHDFSLTVAVPGLTSPLRLQHCPVLRQGLTHVLVHEPYAALQVCATAANVKCTAEALHAWRTGVTRCCVNTWYLSDVIAMKHGLGLALADVDCNDVVLGVNTLAAWHRRCVLAASRQAYVHSVQLRLPGMPSPPHVGVFLASAEVPAWLPSNPQPRVPDAVLTAVSLQLLPLRAFEDDTPFTYVYTAGERAPPNADDDSDGVVRAAVLSVSRMCFGGNVVVLVTENIDTYAGDCYVDAAALGLQGSVVVPNFVVCGTATHAFQYLEVLRDMEVEDNTTDTPMHISRYVVEGAWRQYAFDGIRFAPVLFSMRVLTGRVSVD